MRFRDNSDLLFTLYDNLKPTKSNIFYTYETGEHDISIIRIDGKVVREHRTHGMRVKFYAGLDKFILEHIGHDWVMSGIINAEGVAIHRTNTAINLLDYAYPDFIVAAEDDKLRILNNITESVMAESYIRIHYIECLGMLAGIQYQNGYNGRNPVDIIDTTGIIKRKSVDWDSSYREITGISLHDLFNKV